MEGDAVNWTKVTLDPAKLFLKDHMVKPSIEFANSCWRSRDIHRFLASSKNDLKQIHTTTYTLARLINYF